MGAVPQWLTWDGCLGRFESWAFDRGTELFLAGLEFLLRAVEFCVTLPKGCPQGRGPLGGNWRI